MDRRDKGAIIADLQGTQYAGFSGGYGVFSISHANDRGIGATVAQMHRLPRDAFALALLTAAHRLPSPA